jgi:tripartite-type tricarboxylate transporter receptor subunit TctC
MELRGIDTRRRPVHTRFRSPPPTIEATLSPRFRRFQPPGRFIAFAVTLLLAAAPAIDALAQAWPAKPVKVVVTLSPGSTSDILARVVAEQMGKSLGQSFVIDNRPGAGGNIAGDYVAHQPADGYTVMLASISSHGINPALYARMPYDALRDFAPVIALASSPNVLITSPEVPANSVQELVAWLKARPGAVNYASAGNGTSMHLAAELFNSLAGVSTTHIAYKGSPEAVTAVAKNEVALMFPNAPNAVPLAKAGKLKLLAVTSPKRLSWLPEVPTVAESGLPGFDVVAWFGFVVPAGVPADIVAKLNAEAQKALALPAVRESLAKQGFDVMGGTPQEFGQFMRAEVEKWTRVVNAAGLPKL